MTGDYIYFDNAATSFPKPPSVIKAVTECLKKYSANPGRSGHKLSLLASEKVYSVREKISDFLGTGCPERVVFTSGATSALNLAIKTGVRDGAHVLISNMEHNSVLRVVESLKRRCGVDYSTFDKESSEEELSTLLRENTTHIISTLASNVNGETVDLTFLSDFAKKNGLKLILDASQLLGHAPLSLDGVCFDVLAGAGHKALFGMQGVGFAVFGSDERRESFLEGGSGADSKDVFMPESLPERFEAGTLPTPAIISLGAGIDYINSVGISSVEEHLRLLGCRALDMLRSFPSLSVFGGESGIVSFAHCGLGSEELAGRLDGVGIFVRGGFHCAPLMHKKLGTYGGGTVRLSFSYLNKRRELERFYRRMKEILRGE